MIYKVYKEEVEKFKTQNKRMVNSRSLAQTNPAMSQELSFASGNIFESMAKTNPELFDKVKLTQLSSSTNIVKDFNAYYENLINANIEKYNEFASKISQPPTSDEVNKYYESFNTTYFTAMAADIYQLMNDHGMTEEEATKAVTKMYIPESLTEEGCRKLIGIRIKNNKALTDSLIKMLKLNYTALGISEAEASSLISKLENDETNHEGIGKIKEFLQDPKKLEKFRMGRFNYDFRPIGGGCLFLSEDPSIQFSQHPSKNLSRIFQYDAIVVGHGSYESGTSQTTAKEINAGKNPIFKEIDRYLAAIITKIELKDDDENTSKSLINKFQFIRNIIQRDKDNINNNELKIFCKKLRNELKNIVETDSEFFEEYDDVLDLTNKLYFSINKLSNNIIASEDPKQAMKDGKSTEWVVQPIDTLSSTNNDRMIDIIRNLKKEGFKNIFIGACNPGNVQLPKDIINDKNFKVSMGSSSVYLESQFIDSYLFEEPIYDLCLYSSSYENYTLEGLYEEFDNIQNSYIFTEGAGDVFKNFIKKSMQIVSEIWKRIIQFIKSVYDKIREFALKRFGDENLKLKSPVEMNLIAMKGNSANIIKVSANSIDEIKNNVIKANNDINNFIKNKSREETDWIKKLESLANSGKLKKASEIKNESSIFKNVVFLNS